MQAWNTGCRSFMSSLKACSTVIPGGFGRPRQPGRQARLASWTLSVTIMTRGNRPVTRAHWTPRLQACPRASMSGRKMGCSSEHIPCERSHLLRCLKTMPALNLGRESRTQFRAWACAQEGVNIFEALGGHIAGLRREGSASSSQAGVRRA